MQNGIKQERIIPGMGISAVYTKMKKGQQNREIFSHSIMYTGKYPWYTLIIIVQLSLFLT